MISDNRCSRTLKISFPFGCVLWFNRPHCPFYIWGNWALRLFEATSGGIFTPAVFEFLGFFTCTHTSNCASKYLTEKMLPGKEKYRHSFLLLQFHFQHWKCYECRKRSRASPPLKVYSTRLIALPKEICRRARNRTRISWQPALCLQLKAILLQ